MHPKNDFYNLGMQIEGFKVIIILNCAVVLPQTPFFSRLDYHLYG